MRLLAPTLAFTLVLAGCVAPPDEVDPASLPGAGGAVDALAELAASLVDLPCEATVGGGTSDNMREVALLPYETFSDPTAHGEIDVRGDWMLVARYGASGFELVNTADPRAPAQVALYAPEDASGSLDVKFMPDNKTAVVGHGRTIDLVDISMVVDAGLSVDALVAANLTPELVTRWEHPAPRVPMPVTNMHMLFPIRIGEEDYVFLAPNDDTGTWILKVVGEGADRKFEYVTNVGAPLGGGPLGPHDMWVGLDEMTQKHYLWVSNGFEGWQAYDVSDPASPQLLGLMPNLVGQGYTHSIMAKQVGDRRLLATVAEVGVNTLRIWDVTDIRTPLLLAEWWADRTSPTQMQHNLQIVNGTLYVAHYGYGVYVFDLTTLGAAPLLDSATLAPVARFQPQGANIWDVVLSEGVVYANDIGVGTYAVAFGCVKPGDALATSDG